MTAPTGTTTGTTGIATPFASVQMGTGTAVDKTSLGKEQFLNLLITQMRYQDPSQPMDSSQIMAQTSQMATVEQLTELTSTQREAFALQMRLSASGFVGQQVSWTDAQQVTQTGTVASASFAGPVPVLDVGGKQVSLDQVGLVRARATA
jgi:flagellar basal-body rod modification protein FlgD